MDKNKLKILILLIIFIIPLFQLMYWALPELGQGTSGAETVPLFNVSGYMHITLLLMWMWIGSLVCLIIFPILITPLFLLMKRVIWNKYTDAYVDVDQDSIDLKKFVKRTIYIFLLMLGISSAIIGAFNLDLFISDDAKYHWVDVIGISLEYTPFTFLGVVLIIFPFVIGIWSVGWVLEDVGLMHYKLPKEGEIKVYEIEPIHLKYNSLVKGYAGIAAILYFYGLIVHYISRGIGMGSHTDVFSYGIAIALSYIPAYIFYLTVLLPFLRKRLRKGKKAIPMITERILEEQAAKK